MKRGAARARCSRNVTSITPPGRPPHFFQHTPVDLQQSYTPPDLGTGPTATTYQYNLDKQLTEITRPDGKGISLGYDTGGRMATITAPHGQTTFAYDGTSGQLDSITAPDGETLSFTHDGFLETDVSWSGAVSGTVSRTNDTDFRVTETKVNGADAASVAYDSDGLLVGAGGLTITRNGQNGLITTTGIGSVTDARTYSSYGEPESYTARVDGFPVLAVSTERDDLGRITRKGETVEGLTTTFEYGYDEAGRLAVATKTPQGGTPMVTTYAYDANGNRLSKTDHLGTTEGTYDDQDRLLAWFPTQMATPRPSPTTEWAASCGTGTPPEDG